MKAECCWEKGGEKKHRAAGQNNLQISGLHLNSAVCNAMSKRHDCGHKITEKQEAGGQAQTEVPKLQLLTMLATSAAQHHGPRAQTESPASLLMSSLKNSITHLNPAWQFDSSVCVCVPLNKILLMLVKPVLTTPPTQRLHNVVQRCLQTRRHSEISNAEHKNQTHNGCSLPIRETLG